VIKDFEEVPGRETDVGKGFEEVRKAMIAANPLALSLIIAFALALPVFSVGLRSALADPVKLPEPKYDSKVSVEKALFERRSIRDYTDEAVTIGDVSQLLWAAQGITDPAGYRTAPSAGALYPLEVYLVAGKVATLPAGIYRYKPRGHELDRIIEGDKRVELSNAALGQTALKQAPASIVLTAFYERTTQKYRDRGTRYVHMEAGHAAGNVCLQAVSLGLGTVVIGAFYDDDVKKVMQLGGSEEPLYLIPFGKRSH
jgi:SagB-type dehydrogenase family enzyme